MFYSLFVVWYAWSKVKEYTETDKTLDIYKNANSDLVGLDEYTLYNIYTHTKIGSCCYKIRKC